MHKYDVAIIGGGLVGASLAIALSVSSETPLKVALVEAYPLQSKPGEKPAYQPSYDARSTALAWGTRQIYEDLGVWDAIKAHVTPIKHIHSPWVLEQYRIDAPEALAPLSELLEN